VIGPTGRVTCDELRATTVIVAGAMRGDIVAEKVEIRASGRVWGDVLTTAIATDEGAFLRGQIQMEEELEEVVSEAEEVELETEEKKEAGKKEKKMVKKEKRTKKARD
jgi:cytoskeletal protein CcmA (bactofilin family)